MRFSCAYTVVWCDQISNMPHKQIVYTSKRTPRMNTKGSIKVGEGSERPHCCRKASSTKTRAPGKRRLRNDLVLTHNILYNHIDLEVSQLSRFSRRPGLSRPSIKLPHQTGRTRRRLSSFASWVVNNLNRLPFSVASVTEQRKIKKSY